MFNTFSIKKQDNNSNAFTQLHFSRKSSAGFTIIELLVVIAIIGLISSVVLVSMKGSTGKAKIVKGLEFSQTIMNTIGHDAVGVWTFDEGSGGTAHDKSGYGNHGTINGATFVDGEENTPHWYVNEGEGRSSLKFNGALTQYVKSSNTVVVPQDGTIEGWIKGSTSSQKHQNIYPFGFDHVSLLGPSGGTRERAGVITGTGGSYNHLNWGNKNLYNDKWHHYVVSWVKKGESNYQFHLYIDGKQIGDPKTSTRHPAGQKRYVQIGVAWGTYGAHTGLIDEVRIYERALGSSEIQQHYVEGAEKHEVALK